MRIRQRNALNWLMNHRPDLADEGPTREAPIVVPFPIGPEYWQQHALHHEQPGGKLAMDYYNKHDKKGEII